MNESTGVVVIPLWREFMDFELPKIPVKTFTQPQAVSDTIKPILRGIWFDPTEIVNDGNEYDPTKPLDVSRVVQGAHSILYFVNKDTPNAPGLSDQSDPQFAHWEYPVSLWKSKLMETMKAQ